MKPTQIFKWCPGCEKDLAVSEFYKRKSRAGFSSHCKECSKRNALKAYYQDPQISIARSVAWKRNNPAPTATANRRAQLRYRYGITQDDYDAMVKAQGGVCLICLKPPPEGQLLNTDHDHKTGEVRGLLCGRHNRGLGLFQDSPSKLIRAAAYLQGRLPN